MSEEEEVKDFLKAHAEMEENLDDVLRFIRALKGHKVEPRRTWANVLFYRLFTIGHSIRLLCDPEIRNRKQGGTIPALDHASVAAVSRNLIEAYIMFSYISVPNISEEEWLLRRMLLDLDDVRTRYRVLKYIGDANTDDARMHKAKIEELKQSIAGNPTFQTLDTERQEKLLRGGQLYVKGLRAAAREAGLDVYNYEATQALLSSFTHSTPASFYRAGLGIDEVDTAIAPEQMFAVAGLSLDYLAKLLGLACQRMFDLYPEIFLKDETRH